MATAPAPLSPFHPDALRISPTEAAARRAIQGAQQQLFTIDGTAVVVVPAHAITHLPSAGLHVHRLTLCAHHHYHQSHSAADDVTHSSPDKDDLEVAAPQCPRGARCKYVHTSLSGDELALYPRVDVHENFVYRQLEDARYPRYAPGLRISLMTRSSDMKPPVVDASALLLNRALCADVVSRRAPGVPDALPHVALCLDFSLRRVCPRGANCEMAHLVTVSRRARTGQRAVPSHLTSALSAHVTACEQLHARVVSTQATGTTTSGDRPAFESSSPSSAATGHVADLPPSALEQYQPVTTSGTSTQQDTPPHAAPAREAGQRTADISGDNPSLPERSPASRSLRPPADASVHSGQTSEAISAEVFDAASSHRHFPFEHNPYTAHPVHRAHAEPLRTRSTGTPSV